MTSLMRSGIILLFRSATSTVAAAATSVVVIFVGSRHFSRAHSYAHTQHSITSNAKYICKIQYLSNVNNMFHLDQVNRFQTKSVCERAIRRAHVSVHLIMVCAGCAELSWLAARRSDVWRGTKMSPNMFKRFMMLQVENSNSGNKPGCDCAGSACVFVSVHVLPAVSVCVCVCHHSNFRLFTKCGLFHDFSFIISFFRKVHLHSFFSLFLSSRYRFSVVVVVIFFGDIVSCIRYRRFDCTLSRKCSEAQNHTLTHAG